MESVGRKSRKLSRCECRRQAQSQHCMRVCRSSLTGGLAADDAAASSRWQHASHPARRTKRPRPHSKGGPAWVHASIRCWQLHRQPRQGRRRRSNAKLALASQPHQNVDGGWVRQRGHLSPQLQLQRGERRAVILPLNRARRAWKQQNRLAKAQKRRVARAGTAGRMRAGRVRCWHQTAGEAKHLRGRVRLLMTGARSEPAAGGANSSAGRPARGHSGLAVACSRTSSSDRCG